MSNREQRRHPKPTTIEPLKMDYGHDGKVVVIILNRQVQNITLTEEQTEAMIECLRQVKGGLAEHKRRLAAGEPMDLSRHG